MLFVLGIKLTEDDQQLYKNFPLVISERWQAEVADTVFETINHDYDKVEHKKKAKARKFGSAADEKDSDCILHGYVKKQGGPFGTAWQTRYAKLYPNRLELHSESNKPELTFMDQVEEINTDLVQIKCEQCIMLKTKDGGGKVVITSSDEVGLKEWATSLYLAYKTSQELFSGLAKKAGKIYGSTVDNISLTTNATVSSNHSSNQWKLKKQSTLITNTIFKRLWRVGLPASLSSLDLNDQKYPWESIRAWFGGSCTQRLTGLHLLQCVLGVAPQYTLRACPMR